MQVGTGISILNGIAIGKIKIFKAPTYEISDSLVDDPIPELDRYEKARVKAQEQQNALYEKAVRAAGEDSAGIFEFHAEMLDDDDLNDSVKSIIADQKHTAEAGGGAVGIGIPLRLKLRLYKIAEISVRGYTIAYPHRIGREGYVDRHRREAVVVDRVASRRYKKKRDRSHAYKFVQIISFY